MKRICAGVISLGLAAALFSAGLIGLSVMPTVASATTAATPSNLVTSPSEPTDLALDGAGNLYIANSMNETVQVVPKETGSLFGVPVTANKLATVAVLGQFDEKTQIDALFITLDGSGNLYIASADTNTISVLPRVSGMLFGHSVTAGVLTTLVTLPNRPSALQSNGGDLFVDESGPTGGIIEVLAQSSETVFGVPVTADVLTTIVSSEGVAGLAFDASGNMFLSGNEGISVVARAAGTYLGVSVAANTPTVVVGQGIQQSAGSLAFDAEGDLFALDNNGVDVIPASSGTIFGQSVTADTVKPNIAPGLGSVPWLAGMAIDAAGNLYVTNVSPQSVWVEPVASATLYGVTVVANTARSIVSGLDYPTGLALDAQDNLFIADAGDNAVYVLPKVTGTLFGVDVTAGTLTKLVTQGLDLPTDVAFDSDGNLYVANAGSPGYVSVLAKATGTVFGTPVTVDSLATIATSTPGFTGLAFDSSGNLFVSSGNLSLPSAGSIQVLARQSGTLFGVQVSANTLTGIATLSSGANGITFDGSGNLYVTNGSAYDANGLLQVLPASSGTIFGVGVTANTMATLSSGLLQPGALTFDGGDLFVTNAASNDNMLEVLAGATSSVYGVPVVANTLTSIESGSMGAFGLATDSASDLYLSNAVGTISQFAGPPSPPLPTTSVILPSKGTTLSGSTYLDALATNATNVEFELSGGPSGLPPQVLCSATPTIYGWLCSWNSLTVPNGNYTLVSLATSSAGSASSAGVSITINNPQSTVLTPSNGTTLSGTAATLDAIATGPSPVTGLTFLASGAGFPRQVVATAKATLYGWVASWNTTSVANGTYSLQSVAAYSGGATATSAPVTVTVNNAAPASTVVLPANNAVVSSSQYLDATASPGVSRVIYELSGGPSHISNQPVATATATIYGWLGSWNTTSVADGTYTLQSVASYSGGVSGTSQPLTITIDN
jgi:sugar lactone lactonase YvrE